MGRKTKGIRVLGPYAIVNKPGWYRLQVRGEGTDHTTRIQGRREAEALRKSLEKKLVEGRGGSELVEEYLSGKQVLSITRETMRQKLVRWFGAGLDASINYWTPDQCKKRYVELVASGLSAGTHRDLLRRARVFFDWAIDGGHLRGENPAAKVRPVGVIERGKSQLTLDELRRFVATALADPTREGNIAALALLFLGLRCAELCRARVRDLDDGGRILIIQRGKTRNARRRLRIPEVIVSLLASQAAGKGAEQRLFERDRHWIYNQVERLCRQAGLPRVCPHSLRGSFATLAATAEAPAAVALALGHSSPATTRAHYIEPSSADNIQISQLEKTLLD
jgi:integrase